MLLLYFVIAGTVVGLASGGRLDALARIHIDWWPLAVGGLLFQLVLFGPLGDALGPAAPACYVASSAVVFAALVRNQRAAGFRLIALGAALNLGVIVLNGGAMPSSADAWTALNGVGEIARSGYTNSSLIDAHTLLPWLGDVFALPRPLPLANVFSVGDVLIGVGAVVFLVRSMRGTTAGASTGVPGSRGSAHGLVADRGGQP
jgi:hypothetical protein